ncbi:MAG: type II toxin-antitoxin system RelE/ParE family toxin [Spirochaetales bacterium]|nr:type II toxin-antitoxin system RelE/ParE family toxin [Leptospiraceae bacterium]MCP5482504.1 type II toxin-antitoxin system RelE/ParE family toxin [Spirochaetales bacterium]MCP5485792.1 type II toxin-antitoxin system RelE/ParE family toxin [Spirochaetales bacterium]
MAFDVQIKRSAEKEFRALPEQLRSRIGSALQSLAAEPFPTGAKKLRNRNDFRIRVGDYRILYTVDEVAQQIFVVAIGHRKDIYR